MEWQPIETAPKGEPAPYSVGPKILGLHASADGWHGYNIVSWHYHRNVGKGNWHGPHGVWPPTHWMPLPEPPK